MNYSSPEDQPIHSEFPEFPYTVVTNPEIFTNEHQKIFLENPIFLPDILINFIQDIAEIGGRALVVGGSARDALFGLLMATEIPTKDIDLEVFGLSQDSFLAMAAKVFGPENLILAGKSFGVIKIKVPGLKEYVDFAIPRSEHKGINQETGEDELVINFHPDYSLTEAAVRRDLRINALYYDPLTQEIIDPLNGTIDFETKTLGVARPETFVEDAMRVLRVAQFAARLGFEPDEETIAVCKQVVDSGDLLKEPGERIAEEIKKLFIKGVFPSVGLRFLEKIGFIKQLWPEVAYLFDMPQDPHHHPEGTAWEHTLQTVDAARTIARERKLDNEQTLLLCLSLFCHDLGKATTTMWHFERKKWISYGHEDAGVEPTLTFMNRLILLNDYIPAVIEMVRFHMEPRKIYENYLKNINIKGQLNTLSRNLKYSNLEFLLMVAEADHRGRNGGTNGRPHEPLYLSEVPGLAEMTQFLLEESTRLEINTKPAKSLLTGPDLMNQFHEKSGPWIGAIIKAIDLDEADGVVTTKEEGLLKALHYVEGFKRNYPNRHPFDLDTWALITRAKDPRQLLS